VLHQSQDILVQNPHILLDGALEVWYTYFSICLVGKLIMYFVSYFQ
jgi:hypothetical protein